jgi:hypothetical protein
MLTLTDSLRNQLRQLRAEQLQRPYVDEVLQKEEVVILYLGLGVSLYLALDGRVIIWNELQGEAPRQTTDERDISTGIVIGARHNALSELLELLPRRPPDGVICADCAGERWVRFPMGPGREPAQFVCPTCNGLGWRSAG